MKKYLFSLLSVVLLTSCGASQDVSPAGGVSSTGEVMTIQSEVIKSDESLTTEIPQEWQVVPVNGMVADDAWELVESTDLF